MTGIVDCLSSLLVCLRFLSTAVKRIIVPGFSAGQWSTDRAARQWVHEGNMLGNFALVGYQMYCSSCPCSEGEIVITYSLGCKPTKHHTSINCHVRLVLILYKKGLTETATVTHVVKPLFKAVLWKWCINQYNKIKAITPQTVQNYTSHPSKSFCTLSPSWILR